MTFHIKTDPHSKNVCFTVSSPGDGKPRSQGRRGALLKATRCQLSHWHWGIPQIVLPLWTRNETLEQQPRPHSVVKVTGECLSICGIRARWDIPYYTLVSRMQVEAQISLICPSARVKLQPGLKGQPSYRLCKGSC